MNDTVGDRAVPKIWWNAYECSQFKSDQVSKWITELMMPGDYTASMTTNTNHRGISIPQEAHNFDMSVCTKKI